MPEALSPRILLLQEVASAASTGDLNLVYDKTMAAVRSIVGVKVASLQLLDDEGQGLRFVATLVPGELARLQENDPIPVDENSVSGHVVKHGSPKMFADSWADPVFGERQCRVGQEMGSANRSFICAPLIARDKVLGAISVLHGEPNKFTEDDKNLVVALASFIAMALDHAQFERKVRRVAFDIVSPQLDHVFEESMRALSTLLGAKVGSLQLLDETGRRLEFVTTLIPEELAKLRARSPIPVNENSVSGHVVKHGRPKLFADSWADPFFGQRQRRVAEDLNGANRSFICVPLFGRDKVIGVLNVLDGKPDKFIEADLRMAVILAGFVALGIETADNR